MASVVDEIEFDDGNIPNYAKIIVYVYSKISIKVSI